jgi:hypothetical protein
LCRRRHTLRGQSGTHRRSLPDAFRSLRRRLALRRAGHGYIALLTATIDQLQASRYSDGDGHTAAEPAQSDEPEPGDDA